MFENNKVKFYMQTEVSELREQEGKLKEVVLKSGKVLRADVCIIGIGKAKRHWGIPPWNIISQQLLLCKGLADKWFHEGDVQQGRSTPILKGHQQVRF
ncbi:hypothetical protein FKM82_024287 [Ascaphus truei]